MAEEKQRQMEAMLAVCRGLGTDVRHRPEYGCFTAMVWDGWGDPYYEGPALEIQQQIRQQAAQYSEIVCYCFDPFSTLVYTV